MNVCRLLIVEDDVALAALLQEYLSEVDYDVRLCHRGDSALEILEEETFDIVLSDVMLPGISGQTILSRASGDPSRTLVVLMTGFSGIEDALHAVEHGAYDFVSKPFQLPEIRIRLDNAARYQTLLRRCQDSSATGNQTKVESVRISDQTVERAYGLGEG